MDVIDIVINFLLGFLCCCCVAVGTMVIGLIVNFLKDLWRK